MNLSAGLWWIEIVLSLLATFHVLKYKKDPRAALGWIGIMWLSAPVGIGLYFLFGINRVRRRAKLRRLGRLPSKQDWEQMSPHVYPELVSLQETGNRLNNHPLDCGNDLQVLKNGDETYPAMLEQISAARFSLTLSTYIFDRGRVADQFIKTIVQAQSRGVQARILVDDLGSRYSRPSIVRLLQEQGIPVARFQPLWKLGSLGTINLRNHRKSLVIDGTVGFTGGINIRDGHCLKLDTTKSSDHIQDLHFLLKGPVVSQMQSEFVRDWAYTTGELLTDENWFPKSNAFSSNFSRTNLQMDQLEGRTAKNLVTHARVIADGPDEDYERVRWLLMGALSAARTSFRIVTPYFVPDQILVSALISASLKGVKIQIILPEKNNLPWVQWASNALLWQLLQRGIQIYFQSPPFDHSKFVTVDEDWCLIGSTNIDSRSLRLNFELNVEVFDKGFAKTMNQIFEEKLRKSRRIFLEEMDQRPPWARVRDGAARLFSPYL